MKVYYPPSYRDLIHELPLTSCTNCASEDEKWKRGKNYNFISFSMLNTWQHWTSCSQMDCGLDFFRVYNICILKQQNPYLSVIIVCGYFSLIRSLTWLNDPSKSNSYHKTSLSMSFSCWHFHGIPLCPLHFTVYTIAWQRKFEPQWVFNINLCVKIWNTSHFLYMYTKK